HIQTLAIDVTSARACPQRSGPGLLGKSVYFITQALFSSGFAQEECAFAFREIAADKTGAPDDQIFARTDSARGVQAVWKGRARTRNDERACQSRYRNNRVEFCFHLANHAAHNGLFDFRFARSV